MQLAAFMQKVTTLRDFVLEAGGIGLLDELMYDVEDLDVLLTLGIGTDDFQLPWCPHGPSRSTGLAVQAWRARRKIARAREELKLLGDEIDGFIDFMQELIDTLAAPSEVAGHYAGYRKDLYQVATGILTNFKAELENFRLVESASATELQRWTKWHSKGVESPGWDAGALLSCAFV